jgi:hypothetical protein
MSQLLGLKEILNYDFKRSSISYTSNIINKIPSDGILIDKPGIEDSAMDAT